ncbi:hypothetical protein OH491_23520 [Termitidicoccus mucosus]
MLRHPQAATESVASEKDATHEKTEVKKLEEQTKQHESADTLKLK